MLEFETRLAVRDISCFGQSGRSWIYSPQIASLQVLPLTLSEESRQVSSQVLPRFRYPSAHIKITPIGETHKFPKVVGTQLRSL